MHQLSSQASSRSQSACNFSHDIGEYSGGATPSSCAETWSLRNSPFWSVKYFFSPPWREAKAAPSPRATISVPRDSSSCQNQWPVAMHCLRPACPVTLEVEWLAQKKSLLTCLGARCRRRFRLMSSSCVCCAMLFSENLGLSRNLCRHRCQLLANKFVHAVCCWLLVHCYWMIWCKESIPDCDIPVPW